MHTSAFRKMLKLRLIVFYTKTKQCIAATKVIKLF